MATYNISSESSNATVFNKNKSVRVQTRISNTDINRATDNDNQNTNDNIINSQNTPKTNQLTRTNAAGTNYSYPFNTAVSFNFNIPYLEKNYTRYLRHLPEIYYTFPPASGDSQVKFYQSSSNFQKNKVQRYKFTGDEGVEMDFVHDLALEQYTNELAIAQGLSIQASQAKDIDFTAQNDPIQYYYYNSMNGTCPKCVLTGGDFGLQLGVSFPDNDGPVDASGGFPLTGYSTCESLEAEIADLEDQYAGTSISFGYPIEWSVTYKDGTTISGDDCASVPADYKDAAAQSFGGLSSEECSDLSEQYPNINIIFDVFDTTLISSTTKPSAPAGTPCSDLFGRYA
jgi:hypothetical protein